MVINVIYIINVLLTIVLKKKNPRYEKPKICVFGCVCYLLMRPYNKHKLQFHSSCFTFEQMLTYLNFSKGLNLH